jgi:hypothetical protein
LHKARRRTAVFTANGVIPAILIRELEAVMIPELQAATIPEPQAATIPELQAATIPELQGVNGFTSSPRKSVKRFKGTPSGG